MPEADVARRTSPGPGSSSVTSSISRGALLARMTAALILGMAGLLHGVVGMGLSGCVFGSAVVSRSLARPRRESLADLGAQGQNLATGARIGDMAKRFMLYGATGYTGKLVAALAKRLGLDVILAGRSREKLKEIAEDLGFAFRVVSLADAAGLRRSLSDISAVLHAAGPFSQTAGAMIEACISTGTHYLDVTGEIDVFESIARRGPQAEAAGVILLPGVGFDVVPSDCVALHTASRVEEPTSLRIAIAGGSAVSRGTAKTAIEGLGDGLRIRANGIIRSRPAGSLERHFNFGAGPARALALSWGDVSTAFYSTGIPNIEVYFALSGRTASLIKASRFVKPILGLERVRNFLTDRANDMPEGPDESVRSSTGSLILAEVEGPGGQKARTLLETPNGYALTPVAAVECVRRALAG
ncbi:MAG TPA: hypothetical protein EYG08_14400, partial [Myxococcales bacterium]|nr:hypothetical protein [Myxococcales bacterium]